MRKHMNASIQFLVPEWAKEKLWRLCRERGILPSQFVRDVVLQAIERLEQETISNRKTKEGGEQL